MLQNRNILHNFEIICIISEIFILFGCCGITLIRLDYPSAFSSSLQIVRVLEKGLTGFKIVAIMTTQFELRILSMRNLNCKSMPDNGGSLNRGHCEVTFGQKLRKYRKQKRLSQNALAELSGISLRTIYGYEAGTTYPRTNSILNRLAAALDVTNEELVDDKPDPEVVFFDQSAFPPDKQAQMLTQQLIALLQGDDLSNAEKDMLTREIMDAYWEARRKSREKNDTTT